MTARLAPAHVVTDPAILYVGTPVVLLSTVNPDGTANVAPISSAFWLGDRCTLGLARTSHTWVNLARTGELVVSLPSVAEVDAVDRLALLTGADPVPPPHPSGTPTPAGPSLEGSERRASVRKCGPA